MPTTTRRPGLTLSAYDDHTNEMRSFELPPFVFSPCRWRTRQRFTATGFVQIHTAGVVVGSERDDNTGKFRRFDVEQGDYVVRGQDDMLAVCTPRRFTLLCKRVRASYDITE